ncbi:MAG: hypothetical protein ACI8XB_002374 [Patiriisocius sp.]
MLFSWTTKPSSDGPQETMTHIEMIVTGIRTNNGKIQIGAFIDNDSFRNEESTYAFHFDKDNIDEGTLKVNFDLPAGTYGFSLMDDENDNNKMDYNFFGIPKEGFGFGDYYHSGYTKPDIDKFNMELKAGESKVVTAKMRYVI